MGFSAGQQTDRRPAGLAAGQWADLEISVQGDTYTVLVNGVETSRFTNADAYRGRASDGAALPPSGHLGLQAQTGRVAFRNIRVGP